MNQDSEAVEPLCANLENVFTQFSAIPGVRVVHSAHGPAIFSGCDAEWMNGVIGKKVTLEQLQTWGIPLIGEFRCQSYKATWRVRRGDLNSSIVADWLQKRGCTRVDSEVLMIRRNSLPLPFNNCSLEICPVTSSDLVEQWLVPYQQAFGLTDGDCAFYRNFINRTVEAPGHPFRQFVGRNHSTTVCCGSLYANSGIAALYNIGTSPEFRRLGYGSEMVRRLLNEASEMGFEFTGLFASEMGVELYERLGFAKMDRIDHFLINP